MKKIKVCLIIIISIIILVLLLKLDHSRKYLEGDMRIILIANYIMYAILGVVLSSDFSKYNFRRVAGKILIVVLIGLFMAYTWYIQPLNWFIYLPEEFQIILFIVVAYLGSSFIDMLDKKLNE